MKKKTTYLPTTASWVLLVIVVILIGVILGMASGWDKISTDNDRSGAGEVQALEVWREEVESAASPIGVDVVYSFTVSDPLEHDTHLAFCAVHQYVHVYLGDELVYALEPSGVNDKITTIGSNWVIIPLYREDSGREVRVVLTPAYKHVLELRPEFMLGSPLTVYIEQLGSDLAQLIVGTLMILAGIAFMFTALYGRIVSKKKGTSMLGLFAIMLGIWYFTDSLFAALIFPRSPILLHYLSITMLMICMIPMMKSLKQRYCALSQSVLDVCCTLMAFVCMLEFVMQLLGIADLYEMLPVTWGIIIFCGVIVVCDMAYERIYYPEKYHGPLWRITSWVLAIGGLVDLIIFLVPGDRGGLIFTMPAFLYYIVAKGLDTIYSYTEQENEYIFHPLQQLFRCILGICRHLAGIQPATQRPQCRKLAAGQRRLPRSFDARALCPACHLRIQRTLKRGTRGRVKHGRGIAHAQAIESRGQPPIFLRCGLKRHAHAFGHCFLGGHIARSLGRVNGGAVHVGRCDLQAGELCHLFVRGAIAILCQGGDIGHAAGGIVTIRAAHDELHKMRLAGVPLFQHRSKELFLQ